MQRHTANVGNRTLLVPIAGMILLLVSFTGCLSGVPAVERGMVAFGVALLLGGIVFAGIYGHVVWLVPLALLLLWPLVLWFLLFDRVDGWFARRRRPEPAHSRPPEKLDKDP